MINGNLWYCIGVGLEVLEHHEGDSGSCWVVLPGYINHEYTKLRSAFPSNQCMHDCG